MTRRWSQIWKQLRQSFSVEESLNTTIDTSKTFLDAAKTLQENGANLEVLKPLLQNSSSLLDVLCSPLAQVIGAGLPFVPMGIALLKLCRQNSQEQPTLEDCVFIVSQIAYLESVKEILSSDINVNWDAHLQSDAAVRKQLEKLNDIELDYDAASKTINCFHQSQLAQVFNQVLLARLASANISNIKLLTERVAWNTHRYLVKAWIESGDVTKNVMQISLGEWQKTQQKFQSIDEYLKSQIATKPEEQVFNEDFIFKDIYVSLKARNVDKNGKLDTNTRPFDLENWAKTLLFATSSNTQRQVMFIQGGPGRGKSVFCRMFADWVRQNLHPVWTPILIRLRDIDDFQPSLEETLRSRIKADFAQSDDGWLTDRNTRFLFILDGFDELRIERGNNQSVERFLRQVGTFQNDYQDNKSGHRVIITGRQMALHGIDRLPPNLERVEIAEMDVELQQQWFEKWYRRFPINKTLEFMDFLVKPENKKSCPQQIKELAKEPLLLYMLTAMHRDHILDIKKFEQATETEAKILVYEQALNWVLTKQRADTRHPDLNYELTRQHPEALRRILAEAAVCVVQSGGESASMQMVKARLQQDDEAKELIAKAEKELGEEALKTALGAFYLKSNDHGGVEFFHKSIREFLCAERIKQSLEEWTEPGRRGRTFNVDEQTMDWEIYDLFGYGGLTPEIVEYLMGLLITSDEFHPVELFKRLENFYVRWCKGELIDAPPENFPQKKMRLLQEQGIKQGQRQVDIYAGLNVMILLLELHRYAQGRDELKEEIVFYPSGQPEANNLWTGKLLHIINYCDCVKFGNFINIVGQFLCYANLNSTYLSGTVMSGTLLSNANLSLAELSGVNFSEANLSFADLSGASLDGAYLCYTNLKNADLRGADLSCANLKNADLSGANLSGANLSLADLRATDLDGANLCGVDLTNAKLDDARLSGVDLTDAKLTNASLTGAYLGSTDFGDSFLDAANLTSADLKGAKLKGVDFYSETVGANFENISWDNYTNWENVQGLDTAVNVPEALKQQLGMS
ncbi:pentapeptide repeat-containing protein [Nostoc spongiaeforme FACHB-130]|uniref:Pentapeptide repeat-containing protein n=1 Tax=Nostoc spongiaeforme FACHB-130 TaxID=1357510 RepID=A0ABR8G0L8_9NOSO|nr:pentapeptide repeat-containing protein [Nostoc spongiaeforme]MBD2596774.1 pentapeptide repeat-containing protein [Nostoc spongiaeforme FACHB-130]